MTKVFVNTSLSGRYSVRAVQCGIWRTRHIPGTVLRGR